MQDLATRALAVTADPELRLTARHDAGWALAWSGRRTAALSALISVAEEVARDQPDLAWDALGSAATVAYQSGTPASRQAVSRTLGLLERQGPPPPGRAPGIDVNALRLWIRASADPIGSRNQLLSYLREIVGSPIEEPSLWRIASAAWILDESDLAIRLLQDAMQRLRAPGVRGTSGGSLNVLGWAYIDTGRWDEAVDVAAEAAGMAEANQMELIAASADVITATVLALRADSGAARRHAARALATVDPAECGLVAARARRALSAHVRDPEPGTWGYDGAPAGAGDVYITQSAFPSCIANGLPAREAQALAADQAPLATIALTPGQHDPLRDGGRH